MRGGWSMLRGYDTFSECTTLSFNCPWCGVHYRLDDVRSSRVVVCHCDYCKQVLSLDLFWGTARKVVEQRVDASVLKAGVANTCRSTGVNEQDCRDYIITPSVKAIAYCVCFVLGVCLLPVTCAWPLFSPSNSWRSFWIAALFATIAVVAYGSYVLCVLW